MEINNYLTVAAFQGAIKEGDNQANLEKVLQATQYAEKCDVDILCFPETYLQGYFSSKELALQNAIDLKSREFEQLCECFSSFQRTTVLLGLNEIEGDKIYNTVVVIEKGKCLGKYRKAYTYVPYEYYSLGRDFPIFEKKGIKYGIIVCVDSTFREPAHIAALKGARIIFCPMFNRVPKDARMFAYLHRKSHFIARAYDNHCWFVASDIVWDAGDETCPGFSCIFSDDGELVANAEPFQEMVITYPIPLKNLTERRKIRLLGTPELFEIVNRNYQQTLEQEGLDTANDPVDLGED
jgi:predicted amidohydrolase